MAGFGILGFFIFIIFTIIQIAVGYGIEYHFGPLSKKEIKKGCFDKYLNNPKISLTEKQGLTHVLDSFKSK